MVVGFGKFVQQLQPPLQYLCFCEGGLNEMYICIAALVPATADLGSRGARRSKKSHRVLSTRLLTVDIDYKRSSSGLDVVHVSSHLIM